MPFPRGCPSMLEKLVIRIPGAGLGDMLPFIIETYALLSPYDGLTCLLTVCAIWFRKWHFIHTASRISRSQPVVP